MPTTAPRAHYAPIDPPVRCPMLRLRPRRNASGRCFLLDEPVLFAATQPADVRPMRPEHEQRDDYACDEHRRSRITIPGQNRYRKNRRSEQRSEAYIPGEVEDGDPNHLRDEHWDKGERGEDATRGRHAFATTLSEQEDRLHVAHDRGGAEHERP